MDRVRKSHTNLGTTPLHSRACRRLPRRWGLSVRHAKAQFLLNRDPVLHPGTNSLQRFCGIQAAVYRRYGNGLLCLRGTRIPTPLRLVVDRGVLPSRRAIRRSASHRANPQTQPLPHLLLRNRCSEDASSPGVSDRMLYTVHSSPEKYRCRTAW